MMLCRNPGKRIVAAVMCLVMLFLISPAALAAAPHEDPATAKEVFSGISLFRYYAESLDFVLDKKPAEVEARLGKMPLANILPSLAEATGSFVAASTNISHLVIQIDEDLGSLRELVGQFRLDEALVLSDNISATISRASSNLTLIEQAIETIGKELVLSSSPAGSDLRGAYDGVVERINRIREMLALYADLTEEQLKLMDIILEGLFKSTHITLEIQPTAAFVGEDIRFGGVLTAQGGPLADREVDILVHKARYVTVRTDANGRFQGVLPIPYWYLSELDIQALYYPRDENVGFYLASLSPVVRLNVLFYEARLELTLENRAYPGRETMVSGRFDYGQSPPPNERRVEIYLDGFFITEFVAQEAFTQKIKIGAETDLGRHIITVSSPAVERYVPVVTRARLNVTRENLNLDLNLPPVMLTPWGVGLEGKLSSEVGPLSEALIEMGLGGAQIEVVSPAEGALATRMRVGMILGLIGWQVVVIRVIPGEPGLAPYIFTTRVIVVNPVNLVIFLALLAILGFLISWRLKRFRVFPRIPRRRRVRPMVAVLQKEPVLISGGGVSLVVPTEESVPDGVEPRQRIFYWYRLVVRFLLRIATISLRPQQTLREFADEHRGILGAGAKYFVALTRMVERLLYSPYRPTEADVENSHQLSLRVEEESKPEVDRLPSGGEGSPPFVRRAGELKLGGRALMPSPWRWLSTRLRRN